MGLMMKFVVGAAMVVLGVLGWGSTSIADDAPTPETVPAASQQRLDYMFNSCTSFRGERSSDGAELKIYEKPLLRFTNPLFGVREGLFVAWVDPQNRPVAVGQVFLMKGTVNDWYIEHQSVADCPITLESATNDKWSPSTAGIKWNKFDAETPVPAKSEVLRLAQMRRLADRFRVEDRLTGDDDVLRLMTNPMIRYKDKANGVIDGALFAFVQGTDPELLVLLEAREDSGDKASYHWALAAMTSAAVKAYLDGEHVWSKPSTRGHAQHVFHMRSLSGGVPFPFK